MRFEHVRLLVDDVPACFRFYRDVLGLDVWEGNDESDVYAALDAGAVKIALFRRADMAHAVGAESVGQSDGEHVALVFFTDDVDATAEQLAARGGRLTAPPRDRADWGIRVAHLRDPDGNLIELASRMTLAQLHASGVLPLQVLLRWGAQVQDWPAVADLGQAPGETAWTETLAKCSTAALSELLARLLEREHTIRSVNAAASSELSRLPTTRSGKVCVVGTRPPLDVVHRDPPQCAHPKGHHTGNTEHLRSYLACGTQHGRTETELKEAIIHLAFYAGWPSTMSAFRRRATGSLRVVRWRMPARPWRRSG